MNTRKADIRRILLDIISGRESTQYGASQVSNLVSGVAEVLGRRANKPRDYAGMFSHRAQLDHDDELLVHETIWDLLFERVLTPGMDAANISLPWLRVHSEAQDRLKTLQ